MTLPSSDQINALSGLITGIIATVGTVFGYIFGHKHGRDSMTNDNKAKDENTSVQK